MKDRIREFLKKYNIQNKTVIIAFSGGFDSSCLLDLVCKLKEELSIVPVAVHLNHNWRGQESLQEEKNCAKKCQNYGISFYSETLPENIPHTETEAREARYDFFERCAKKFKTDVVLTAHNADDNAETVIYRIAKGTGLDGLKGISENRDIYYRPLLKIFRKEIEKYCVDNKLCPNNDSSNKNTKYKRNLIREEIFPLLENINESAKQSINTLSQNAQNDFEIIKEYLALLKDKQNTQNFIHYSPALQNRIIHELIDCDHKKTLELVQFIKDNSNSKNGKKCSITDKIFLFANKDEFRLVKENIKEEIIIKITKEGEYKINNFLFSIEKCSETPNEYPQDKENKAFAELDKIAFELRHRKDGDTISPLGTKGTQKLKKYLSEKGIPRDLRDQKLFLCSGQEVLWAPSLGISEKIKVKTVPTHILKLEKINE